MSATTCRWGLERIRDPVLQAQPPNDLVQVDDIERRERFVQLPYNDVLPITRGDGLGSFVVDGATIELHRPEITTGSTRTGG